MRRVGETPELTEGAMRRLCAHSWRGNVRELQNVIEHVAVLAEAGVAIRAEDLPLRGDAAATTGSVTVDTTLSGVDECYHPARDRVIYKSIYRSASRDCPDSAADRNEHSRS